MELSGTTNTGAQVASAPVRDDGDDEQAATDAYVIIRDRVARRQGAPNVMCCVLQAPRFGDGSIGSAAVEGAGNKTELEEKVLGDGLAVGASDR
jgi:hypothetical protein